MLKAYKSLNNQEGDRVSQEYKLIGEKMMLVFYIICGCLVFAISGLIMQFNRLAIYRRRIIRHFSTHTEQASPFVLSKAQEQTIKQCFLKGIKIQECIEKLEQ